MALEEGTTKEERAVKEGTTKEERAMKEERPTKDERAGDNSPVPSGGTRKLVSMTSRNGERM